MATTQNTYTGNGSLTEYSFTFPYLEESDVKVSLDAVDQLTTAYSFANATTISFNTAPGTGVAIRIYRQTAQEAPPATFFAGSAIRASDLNDNFLQQLYVAQETDNIARNLTAGSIAPGSIGNAQLADNAVTSAKIADNNVTTAKINTAAVTAAKIADGEVVKGLTLDQTSYAGTSPITVTEPTTDNKQINIASTSNAYGIRHVSASLPTAGDGSDGDIWYVT